MQFHCRREFCKHALENGSFVIAWPVEQQNNAITNKLLDFLDKTPPTKNVNKNHTHDHIV
jgi:hypothetical protein